jgi:hypothetical protein
VTLNGELLGRLPAPGTSGRYDVTGRLLARNELALHLDEAGGVNDAAAAPAGEVCLEICPDDEGSTTVQEGDES